MQTIKRNNRSKIIYECKPCDVHPFKPNQRVISISEIIRKACDFLCVPVEKIQSARRDRYIVDARRLLAGILYHDLTYRLTKKEIGKFLGNRDHTTIIHLLRTLQIICETEEEFKNRYYDLHMHVYGNDRYFIF